MPRGRQVSDEAGLPARKERTHKGWLVKAQVMFVGADGEPHLYDEMPRGKAKGDKKGLRLGPRKLKDGPPGQDGRPTKVAVTPEEEPVIIDRELIPHDQALEFQEQGALEPHYA